MAATTTIAWTHATFNPWEGCSKVSPGCEHCYAEARANRFGTARWGPGGTRRVASESYWRQPLKWDREAAKAGERRRVFCASLADVFEDRPELVAPRVRLFHLISETQNLDWLLLTKRPENVVRFQGGNGVPRSWPENMPPNVWLGVSAEDQKRADERLPRLVNIPAAVRFVSAEPLLGELRLQHEFDGKLVRNWLVPGGVDWVIIGGESGPDARACDLAWVRSLVRQCKSAGVACFVKQLGSRPRHGASDGFPHAAGDVTSPRTVGDGFGNYHVTLRDKKGGDMAEWPEDLRVREFPRPRP